MIFYKPEHLRSLSLFDKDFFPRDFDQTNPNDLFIIYNNRTSYELGYIYPQQRIVWNILKNQFLESML